jgi:hypothetical protein
MVKVGSVEGKVAPRLRLKAPRSAAGGSKGALATSSQTRSRMAAFSALRTDIEKASRAFCSAETVPEGTH